MMTKEKAREFASRWLPAWTGNDPGKLADFYSDDAFISTPPCPEGSRERTLCLPTSGSSWPQNPNWVWTQIEAIPMEGGFLNKWLARIPIGDKIIECIGVCFVQFDDRERSGATRSTLIGPR